MSTAMSQILLALFPSIALIASGYVFQQRRFFATEFWNGAEKLNYYVFFPALLFSSLALAQADWQHLSDVIWTMLSVIAVVMLLMYGLRAKRHILPARFGVYVQSAVRFNTYIGLAIVSALAAGNGSQMLAVILAVCIPLVNVISIIALLPKEQLRLGNVLVSVLKNPLVSSCVVGIAVNLLDIPLWMGLQQLLKLLATCSLTMGLLCVGAALQFTQVKNKLSLVMLNSVWRLLCIPMLAWGMCLLFGLNEVATQVLVIFFGLPTASASYILTKVLKGDAPLMASIISMQTLLSMVTLPLLIVLTA